MKCCVCGKNTIVNLMCNTCNHDVQKNKIPFVFKLTEEEKGAYKVNCIVTKNNKDVERNLSVHDKQLVTNHVMSVQRQSVFELRNRVLNGENMRDEILEMIAVNIYIGVCAYFEKGDETMVGLLDLIPLEPATLERLQKDNKSELEIKLKLEAVTLYENKEDEFPSDEDFRKIERDILLKTIDRVWQDEDVDFFGPILISWEVLPELFRVKFDGKVVREPVSNISSLVNMPEEDFEYFFSDNIYTIGTEVRRLYNKVYDWLCYGKGEEITSTTIGFQTLINELKKLYSYCYYEEIILFMKEVGYDVAGKNNYELMDQFFNMSYEKQALVLSHMFHVPLEQYEIKSNSNRPLGLTKYTIKDIMNEDRKNENSLRKGTVRRLTGKIYPGDACPCGSGRRFNECCGRKA